MSFSTIAPLSCMDGKEGLYLFITLVWGILILLSDYRHTGTIIHGMWMSFGIFLIIVSVYIFLAYCVYPAIINDVYRWAESYILNTYSFQLIAQKFREWLEKFLEGSLLK